MSKLAQLFMDFIYLQADRLARRDPMTGLLNCRHIRKELSEAIRQARRKNTQVHVIMMDLDRFKDINDKYGHPVGDEVIKTFSRILGSSRRTGEYAGRIGGEEFLIVLKNSTQKEACQAAERILREVRQATVPVSIDQAVSFRVSMGIAGFPNDGLAPEYLIENADRALYAAKIGGRDRYVIWEREGMEQYRVCLPAK